MTQTMLLIALMLLPAMTACREEYEWTDFRRGSTECLVAVFPEKATGSEVYAFLQEQTSGPGSPNRPGRPLREGISAVFKQSVEGRVAYEICFWPDATQEQKRVVREAFASSPALERVLEGGPDAEAKRRVEQ